MKISGVYHSLPGEGLYCTGLLSVMDSMVSFFLLPAELARCLPLITLGVVVLTGDLELDLV